MFRDTWPSQARIQFALVTTRALDAFLSPSVTSMDLTVTR
ncbi:hypothetical protein RRG08_040003 [Elysia crispata]|uniref:Uncharacterized protein n=1 Tax=Elysia crispata TaxID=231223 RepID=A0AAE0Z7X2_9GAST|nr:hypothetical protein RRG08_040003 [Elysia crispata]